MTLLAPEVAGVGYLPYRMNGKANTAHADGTSGGGQRSLPLHEPGEELFPADKIAEIESAGCLAQQERRGIIEGFYS